MSKQTNRLIRVGTASAKEHNAWGEGVSLEKDFNASLADLRRRVATARYQLAREMKLAGKAVLKYKNPAYRQAISRCYYCMYHSLRAVAFAYYGGDDHESHSELPKKVPDDFPDFMKWRNQLKSAREYRNQADYDPYPKSPSYWKQISLTVEADADEVVKLSAVYLRARGCTV